jgi:hypothetical protein
MLLIAIQPEPSQIYIITQILCLWLGLKIMLHESHPKMFRQYCLICDCIWKFWRKCSKAYLSDSMECSLGKTNMLSDSQEIASLLRNPKVHYCIQEATTFSLLKPDQSSPCLPILFTIVLWSSKWSLSCARYPIKILYALLFYTCHMP